ncbi:hypothetical protein IP80_03435 [beta proteobacterium AAP65]|nr:hypothetical protein IP80_03435 [beta proteobacterium AAP65]
MAYRWSLEGPAFEFPSPYGTENRFLVWRGYALIALAVVIAAVVSFVGGEVPELAVTLEKPPEPASAVPHLVAAMLLLMLGARDLWKASAQRQLLLAPGQPASLMPEVPREGSGLSPGAAALQRLLEVGEHRTPTLQGSYATALQWLGPELAHAPSTLHDHLRVRFSHLLLVLGLAVVLVLGFLVFQTAPAQGVAALVPLMACAGVLAARALHPEHKAMPPWLVLLLVLLAGGFAGVLGWFAEALPRSASVPRLGLPLAATVMLFSVLLFEGLGVLAARAQLQTPWLPAVAPEAVAAEQEADPEQLMRDVDLELHRQWTEGIPNRRYGWLTPQLPRGAEGGRFRALVLEESQPLVATAPMARAAQAPGRAASALAALPVPAAPTQAPQRAALLALNVGGLVWSLAGSVAWLWLASAHMLNPAASWVPAASGIAALAVGGYALRIGHLLWSRVEVVSTLTWLELEGAWARAPEAQRGRDEGAARTQGWQMRGRVAVLRSMFYAAAPHGPGSRVMLALAAHGAGATAWLNTVQELARKAAPVATPSAAVAAAAAARPRPREPEAAAPAPAFAPAAAAPRRSARFCTHCGTAVPAGARFCQHCGSVLPAE